MTEPDFHALRRTGIGGGDAAAAIGVSPWRTPYDLWREKTTGDGELTVPNEPMRWGTLLEPVIVAEYSRRTGRALMPIEEMRRHPDLPWMIAHIDRCIAGEPRILEVKTARDARGWGEPGSDEIPLHYLVQVHHYLVVSGAEIADIAVLVGGSDFRLYEVRRDDVIAHSLIEQEASFWHQVETRTPPPPANLGDMITRWGKIAAPGAVTATDSERLVIDQLRLIHERRRDLDAAEDEAKSMLLQALGERGDTLVDAAGNVLASWKLDRGRRAYTVEAREPARRFLLKS